MSAKAAPPDPTTGHCQSCAVLQIQCPTSKRTCSTWSQDHGGHMGEVLSENSSSGYTVLGGMWITTTSRFCWAIPCTWLHQGERHEVQYQGVKVAKWSRGFLLAYCVEHSWLSQRWCGARSVIEFLHWRRITGRLRPQPTCRSHKRLHYSSVITPIV